MRGNGSQWVGVMLDPAQWGEAITNPHIRVCPLNQQYLKTFLAAVVKSRDKQQLTLHNRDLFFYFDSFLAGNLSKVLGSFQTPAGDALGKSSFTVFVSYDEDSLRLRRQYIKSNSTTFQQVEQLTLVTAENFGDAMTKQNRKLYKGSNFGNKIGDVMLDSPKTLWSMTLKARIVLVCFFPVHHVCNFWVALLQDKVTQVPSAGGWPHAWESRKSSWSQHQEDDY